MACDGLLRRGIIEQIVTAVSLTVPGVTERTLKQS